MWDDSKMSLSEFTFIQFSWFCIFVKYVSLDFSVKKPSMCFWRVFSATIVGFKHPSLHDIPSRFTLIWKVIWRFPEIGVPLNHHGIFPYKPSIMGYLHSWKPSLNCCALPALIRYVICFNAPVGWNTDTFFSTALVV